MSLELRNVKYAGFASQETSCFAAALWLDGVKIGTVENDGRGGCNMYLPHDCEAAILAIAAKLPAVSADVGNGETFTYQPDADMLVGDLLTDWLVARDFKRAVAKRILFTKADGRIYQTKTMPAAELKRLLAPPLRAPAGAVHILNLLPEAEALKLYRAAP